MRPAPGLTRGLAVLAALVVAGAVVAATVRRNCRTPTRAAWAAPVTSAAAAADTFMACCTRPGEVL